MRLIVSIHDVTPERLDEADHWRAVVQGRMPGPLSLLVVPRYGGHGSWRRGPGGAWLRARERAGDEVVVHGYTHTRGGRDGAETAGRGPQDVCTLVSEGTAELRSLGVSPGGFIAPAYGRARGLAAACAAADLTWWATRLALRGAGVHRSVPSVGLGASRASRRALSPFVARTMAAALARSPVVRRDLHTADVHHPRLARAGADLLEIFLGQGRRPATHGALVRH